VDELTFRSGRVRAARRLARRAVRTSERRFLVEGPQAVREALLRDDCVLEVFATYDGGQHHRQLREAAASAGVPWHLADVHALASLTETVTPQGIVAVCRFIDVDLATVAAGTPRLLAVCVNVRDPGNAGTVIRCADAAGADAVVLAGTSVDPYNGKAVRASAGSLFHVPVVFGVPVEEAVSGLRRAGVSVLAADGGGQVSLDDAESLGLLAEPTAWLFGNEAWGLPAEVALLADRVVRVPIYGRAESLNIAAASAVCLYASARVQRRVDGSC
jgi:RNA methyltransferase, TrmH family